MWPRPALRAGARSRLGEHPSVLTFWETVGLQDKPSGISDPELSRGTFKYHKAQKNPRPYLVLHQRSEVCSRGAGTKRRQEGDQHEPGFLRRELFPHTDPPSSSLLPLMLRSPTLIATSSGSPHLTSVFLTFQRCCPRS